MAIRPIRQHSPTPAIRHDRPARSSGRGVTGALLVAAALLGAAACGDDGTRPPVVTIAVSPTTLALEVGESAPLAATVSGASGASVSWSSSNTAIATVDGSGQVTGVAAGSANVTATVTGEAGVSASAAVSVTEPPLSVEIIGFFKDGAPADPSSLAGRVETRVRLVAPATATGRIEIVAGNVVLGSVEIGAGAASAALGGALSRAPPAAASARESLVDIPTAVTAFDAETLTAGVPNDRDISAIARYVPGLGDPVQSGGFPIRGNNPSVLLLDNFGSDGASLTTGGVTWRAGSFNARARMLDYYSSGGPLQSLDRIEVLRGPQATVFGRNATAGVVNLTLRSDQPVLSGGVGDVEGELRWGAQADITRTGGVQETVLVANGLDLYPEFPNTFFPDNVGPQVEPGLFFTPPIWLSSDLQAQFSANPGIRWADDANGPATVFDQGVGGVTGSIRGGFTLDYELGIYVDGGSVPETPPAIFLSGEFVDALGNTVSFPFRDQFGDFALAGRDATAPAAPVFRVGASFTPDGAINPSLLNYGWDAVDIPGGGGVVSGILDKYRIRAAWGRSGEIGCIVGSLVDGDCSTVELGGGINDGWSPDASGLGSAELTFYVGATDGGLNFGPSARRDALLDGQPPILAGQTSFPADLSGTVSLTLPTATDELEIQRMLVFPQFQATGLDPLVLLAEGVDLGTPFDGVWTTTATPTVSIPWYRGIETTDLGFPSRPTGTFYNPTGVAVTAEDHAFNSAFNVTPVTANVAPTTSHLVGGLDHFGFRAGPRVVCSAETAAANACGGVPTGIDLTMETFTSGQFDIDQVQLWGVLPGPPGQISAARLSDIIDISITDQGTFREGLATFNLDALAEGLHPGMIDIFWLGWDPTGKGLMTNPVMIEIR